MLSNSELAVRHLNSRRASRGMLAAQALCFHGIKRDCMAMNLGA